MLAIGGDDVVVGAKGVHRTGGHGFFANVEMKETTDLLGLVGAEGALLKAANAHHRGEERDLVGLAQLFIDGSAEGRTRVIGGYPGFGVGGGTRFLVRVGRHRIG